MIYLSNEFVIMKMLNYSWGFGDGRYGLKVKAEAEAEGFSKFCSEYQRLRRIISFKS